MKGINSARGGQCIIAALRQLPPRRPTRWLANRPAHRQSPTHFTTPFSTCRALRADEPNKKDDSKLSTGENTAGEETNASESSTAEKLQDAEAEGDLKANSPEQSDEPVSSPGESSAEGKSQPLETKTPTIVSATAESSISVQPDEIKSAEDREAEELMDELETLMKEELEAGQGGEGSFRQGLSRYLPPEQLEELKKSTAEMLQKEPGSVETLAKERPLTLQLLFQEDKGLRERIARTHPELVEKVTNLDAQSLDLALLKQLSEEDPEDLEEFEKKLRDPAYHELLREEERKIQKEEQEDEDEDDRDNTSDRTLRIVPASPSYFTGQPDFTDGLLELRRLLRKYEILPTVAPVHAPRVAWKKYAQYKVDINEPVRAAKYHKIIEVLQRLNRIHPSLMPEEVVAILQRYKRDINPHDNRPNPVFIDEHGRAVGIGRRKTSSAKVWVVEGTGEVLINGKTLTQMFSRLHDRESAVWALKATQRIDKYNVFALVTGGGITGQAEAITLAIAKALMVHEPALKPALRRAGCVTRDPRKVERKKAGKVKARKMPAWVKR